MKKQVKKWVIRLAATVVLISSLLLTIVLNPILSYANKTKHNNLTIYHHSNIHPGLLKSLNEAMTLIKSSELYTPGINLDICLNDGSNYPLIPNKIFGQAFAWGFYNKVVLNGIPDYPGNNVALNGYKWNLTQLLAHEMIHCLQFKTLGFWHSKPVSDIPDWKWEGYAEYISRKPDSEHSLSKNIKTLLNSNTSEWAVKYDTETIIPRSYLEYWCLIQYCMDIKRMSFVEILNSSPDEATLKMEMIDWLKKAEETYK